MKRKSTTKARVKSIKKRTIKKAKSKVKKAAQPKPKVVKTVNKQTHKNQTKRGKKLDKKKKALPPGWRISKNGNRYYEDRANRSDLSRDAPKTGKRKKR